MSTVFLPKLKVVLGSKSPRRKALLTELGLQVRVQPLHVNESYPSDLSPEEVVSFLAAKKNEAYTSYGPNEVLITSDTVVCLGDEILEKAADASEATAMLKKLSNQKHRVLTAVCINGMGYWKKSFTVSTTVYFKKLTDQEIAYYVDHYKPFDKAGAYGIQEWIGMVAVEKIEGSYYNVVGLPVHEVVKYLSKFHDELD